MKSIGVLLSKMPIKSEDSHAKSSGSAWQASPAAVCHSESPFGEDLNCSRAYKIRHDDDGYEQRTRYVVARPHIGSEV